jgi:16S rRNA processing protein RimM
MNKGSPGAGRPGVARSLLPVEPTLLAVGKLMHAHGVHGEMLMEIYTDFPERLVPGVVLYLDTPGDSLRLVKRRSHKHGLLVTFEGYTTPEAVGQFRNRLVFVRADDRPPLAKGEYYHHQLLNLRVLSEAGEVLGVVEQIIETGASDVLVVRPSFGPEVLIPMVDTFVREVDLQAGSITVRLIPGMLVEEP